MTTESVAAPPAVVKDAPTGSDQDPDDSSYGWVMFLMFLTAALAITFAICALAMAPSWWMLGVVFGTDVIVTGLVFKIMFGAFVSPAYPDLEKARGDHGAAFLARELRNTAVWPQRSAAMPAARPRAGGSIPRR